MNVVDSGTDYAAIAQCFVEARRAGRPLTEYPGSPPTTLRGAYAVQDAALALADQRVVGWKVGRIDPPIDGFNRLTGPIFANSFAQFDGGSPEMTVYSGGFAAAEAEFMLRIGDKFDPARTIYSWTDAIDAIDAVHVGIEIASSPYRGINDHGALVTISDFGNNNGMVVGPAIDEGMATDFDAWQVELFVNGVSTGRSTTMTMLDGPIGAARYVFESMAARGIALRPGQWISSGAVTGVHPVKVGDQVEARFGDRLSVKCDVTSA